MQQNLFSIRMRAASGGRHEDGGKHISGAEKIVPEQSIPIILEELYNRARQHKLGRPDFINLTIEHISDKDINKIVSLPLYTVQCRDYQEGRNLARKILALIGIKSQIVEKGFHYLLTNDKSGSSMRGAILMDIQSGCRLEPDQNRGIRASRMDYSPAVSQALSAALSRFGLNNNHVREALCLASKVANVPGITAELCWSDDPGYTAGYIAAAHLGYIRLPHLKEAGSSNGGRIFFINPNRVKVQTVIETLEQKPYIITELGPIHAEFSYEKLIKGLFNNEIPARGTG